MPTPFVDRLFFVVAIAMIAASFGDPFVEVLGNHGAFGAGYHDSNHLGVVPAIGLGLAFALAFAVRRALAGVDTARRDEVIAFARTAAAPKTLRLFASVVALELAAVYAIEAFESLFSGSAVTQHAGAFGWLGAPLAIALAIHGAVAWLMLHFARAISASSLAALERLVAALERFVVALTRPGAAARPVDMRRTAVAHTASEYTWRIHGLRAPPALVLVRR